MPTLAFDLRSNSVKVSFGHGDYGSPFSGSVRVSCLLEDKEFTREAVQEHVSGMLQRREHGRIHDYLTSVNEAICKKFRIDHITLMLHGGALECRVFRNQGGPNMETAIWFQHGGDWFTY